MEVEEYETDRLHLCERQLAELLDRLDRVHHVSVVSAVLHPNEREVVSAAPFRHSSSRSNTKKTHDSWHGPQQLLRRHTPAPTSSLPSPILIRASNQDGLLCARLRVVDFEVGEDIGGREGRGRPDDAQTGEGEGEEDEAGLDVRVGDGPVTGGAGGWVRAGGLRVRSFELDDGLS